MVRKKDEKNLDGLVNVGLILTQHQDAPEQEKEMKISVDGKETELAIFDASTGVEFTADLIDSNGGFRGPDNDLSMPKMTKKDFDWWGAYIIREQDILNRLHMIRGRIGDIDRRYLELGMSAAQDSDLVAVQNAMLELLEYWEVKA